MTRVRAGLTALALGLALSFAALATTSAPAHADSGWEKFTIPHCLGNGRFGCLFKVQIEVSCDGQYAHLRHGDDFPLRLCERPIRGK